MRDDITIMPSVGTETRSAVRTRAWVRPALIFSAGMFAGVVLFAVVVAAFLRSASGVALLQDWWLSYNSSAFTATLSSKNSELSSTTAVLGGVPSAPSVGSVGAGAPVSAAYYPALNAVVSDYNGWTTIQSQKVAPLMQTLATQAISGNLAGIVDRISEAKSLIAQSDQYAAALAHDLGSLAKANESTTDTQARDLTYTLVSQGTTMHNDMVAYSGSLTALLTGEIPGGQQISAATAAGSRVSADATVFSGSVASLVKYLSAAGNQPKP